MATKDIALKLLALDKGRRAAIVAKATQTYMQILYRIANDIYDSCIADFYSGYIPTSYTRHGNIEGFNLYLANDIFMQNGYLGIEISESNLLPYGKKTSKRKVFNSVVNGLRGGPGVTGFPMDWDTSYPNSYSMYKGVWSSSGNTIQSIYSDFFENVIKDTADLFWNCVDKII
jgi:hypothetical protein